MDIAESFREAGWTIMGPVGTIEQATQALRSGMPRAAIFDVNLNGRSSVDLARMLQDSDVFVVFLTGHATTDLPDRHPDTQVIVKPARTDDIVAAFAHLLVPRPKTLSVSRDRSRHDLGPPDQGRPIRATRSGPQYPIPELSPPLRVFVF